MDADQESRADSEIAKIQASFGDCASYLRHLNDAESHQRLRNAISMQLWKRSKQEFQATRLNMFARLIAST